MMLIQSTPYAIKLSPLSLAGGVLSGVEGERVGERVEAQRLGGYSELSTPSLALPPARWRGLFLYYNGID